MPDYMDKMIVVDDYSRDNTVGVIEATMEKEPKVILIKHEKNQGVGGAIATGYKWARDNYIDVVFDIDNLATNIKYIKSSEKESINKRDKCIRYNRVIFKQVVYLRDYKEL